jgi:predicted ATPase with chaperone activity
LKPETELRETDLAWFMDHVDRSEMSVRRSMKWLRVARTVADLNDEKQILREHLIQAQALSLQSLTQRGHGSWA